MATVSRLAALTIGLLAAAACAQQRCAAAAPAARTCVAVLETEVLAEVPAGERQALAAAVETLLSESLGKQKDFALVDRRALDKVLAERTSQAAGVTRVAPTEVAKKLRPFWAVGVLVCSRVDAKADAVLIEAVSAQTGQVVAAVYAKANVASADAVVGAIGPRMERFARDIRLGIARLQGRPLLEISGRLNSGLSRLAWMVDDLAEAAGARVGRCRFSPGGAGRVDHRRTAQGHVAGPRPRHARCRHRPVPSTGDAPVGRAGSEGTILGASN